MVCEAVQLEAGIVVFTPGPETTHELLMPVPVTVSVEVCPLFTRDGLAVMETVGLVQLGA